MDITIERIKPNAMLIKCQIPPETVASRLNEMVNDYKERVVVPGFRPGKAPNAMILARYGDTFRNDLQAQFIREIFSEAVKQEPELKNIIYSDEPVFEPISDGNPFIVEIYVEVKPRINLSKYTGFKLTYPKVSVPDEEVDLMIKDFLNRNATLEKRERPVAEGDYVEVKLSDGEEEPIPMILPLDDPEFIQFFGELLGKSVGETIECDIEFPDSFPDRRLQGRKGHFTIELLSVFEQVVPKLDEQFLKKIGKPEGYTPEQFRDEVAQYAQQQNLRHIDNFIKQKLIDILIETNPVEIPPKFLNARIQNYISEQWNISKMKESDVDELIENVRPEIEKKVAIEFILDEIAKLESIEPSQQDIDDAIQDWANSLMISREAAQDIIKSDEDRYENFVNKVRRAKTMEFVMSTCKTVTEQENQPTESDEGKDESQL